MAQQKANWLHIDLRLCAYLTLAFVLFTVIGTLTHEMAHYLAARAFGYQALITYQATRYSASIIFPEHAFIIRLCGPLQTVLTGSIGFGLLRYIRNDFRRKENLQFWQWLLVFFALFWLRQVFNFLAACLEYLNTGSYPTGTDEVLLAAYLHLPPLGLELPLAVFGFLIVLYVFFRCVPAQQRLTFLLAAFVGGLSGFYLWMYLLGPVLLP